MQPMYVLVCHDLDSSPTVYHVEEAFSGVCMGIYAPITFADFRDLVIATIPLAEDYDIYVQTEIPTGKHHWSAEVDEAAQRIELIPTAITRPTIIPFPSWVHH